MIIGNIITFDGLTGLLLGGASAIASGVKESVDNEYRRNVANARKDETYLDSKGEERLAKNGHRVARMSNSEGHVIMRDMDKGFKPIKDCTLDYIRQRSEEEKRKAIEDGEKYYTLWQIRNEPFEKYNNVSGMKHYSTDNDEMYVLRQIGDNEYYMHIKSRTIGECTSRLKIEKCNETAKKARIREAEWIKKWNYAVTKLGYYEGNYLNDLACQLNLYKKPKKIGSIERDYPYVFLIDIEGEED